MAATFSNTLANLMLTVLADQATHVSLHTASPGINGANEITAADGYTRGQINLVVPAAQKLANDSSVEFGPAIETWPSVTYFGLWDAVSGGNFLAGGALANARIVAEDHTANFLIAALLLSLKALP